MTVWGYIQERLAGGKMHMTLLDPAKGPAEEMGDLAAMATETGTDAIMVGGSTGVAQDLLDAGVRAIKARTALPVILFPAHAGTVSRYADAIYFMSLLNSRSVRLVVREQHRASREIVEMGLETLSMGYVVVAPGMKVGEVGEADLIPREDAEAAVRYALTAQLLGMGLFYLEAGSGAPKPVPSGMVRAVKGAIRIPLLVGGGIRTADAARGVAQAGADVVVTGTVVERQGGRKALKGIVDAVKER